MRLLTRSLTLVLLSGSLLAAGCGGEDGDQSSATRLDINAVVRTAEADKTAAIKGTVTVEGMGLKAPLTIDAAGTGSMTNMEMDVTLKGKPLFERMGVPADDDIRFVWLGPKAYVKAPDAFVEQVPGQRPWIGVDLAGITGTEDKAFEALMRMDIAASLAPFEAGATLDVDGTEEIDGVETTRWKGEMSIDDYLDTRPAGERDELRKSLTSGPTAVSAEDLARKQPITFWIDEENRPRRMEGTTTTAATNGMPAGTVTMRFDYSDFGGPAPITAPADDEVWDATDALADASAQAAAAAE